MPRRPRIHFPGALYRVITRGSRKQVAYLAKKVSGYSVEEAADSFRPPPGTTRETVAKVEDRVATDKSLESAVSLMGMRLVKGRKGKYLISDASPHRVFRFTRLRFYFFGFR